PSCPVSSPGSMTAQPEARIMRPSYSNRRLLRDLRGALHVDGAIVEERHEGADRGQDRREDSPDDARRGRELGNGAPVLFHDHAPDVALVNQPLQLLDSLITTCLDRFPPSSFGHNPAP